MLAFVRALSVLGLVAPLLAFRGTPNGATPLIVGRPGKVTVLAGGARWPAQSRVKLRGPVVVPAGATLTIEAGVLVEAAAGAGIVVERDARVNAQGTILEPIVFSCTTTPVVAGCWDGLTILGNAPLHHGAATSPAGDRGGAGGCRESTLDAAPYGGCTATDSSGVLRYVRVQYATHGLRLYGVGSATVLEQLQVHRSLGHGLEVVGGAARLRYVALTANAQYGLAYRGGWVGQAQYVVIQQDATGYAGGLLGENAAPSTGDPNATPRSAPTLANLTIVAPTSAPANPYLPAAPAALRFARGGAGVLYNILLVEPAIGVDVDDASTCAQLSAGALGLRGVVATSPASLTDPDADPTECTPVGEAALVSGATTLTGPQLRSPLDVVLPDLRARFGSALASSVGQTPPTGASLDAVMFLGAIPPGTSGSEIPWYSGWTLGEQLAPPALFAVTGTVTGTNGRGPLANVIVRMDPIGLTATTNGSGSFSFAAVPRGPSTLGVAGPLPVGCGNADTTLTNPPSGPLTLSIPCSRITTTIASIAPNESATNSDSIQFTFLSDTPGSTFECRLDLQPFGPCTSPLKLLGLAEGARSFTVRAVLNGGGVDPIGAQYTWTVDRLAPALASIAAVTESTRLIITWSTNEPATTRIDWGTIPSTPFSVPDDGVLKTQHSVTLSGLAPATLNYFFVGGRDAARNEFRSNRFSTRTRP